jgi:hypothetical protein
MDNTAKSFMNIAYKAFSRGHEDIAAELATAAFESEDAEAAFADAEFGSQSEQLSIEQINAYTDLVADISAAGHEDIAAELVDYISAAVEAKAGVESEDISAEPTEEEIDAELEQLLAEGEDSESGAECECGGKGCPTCADDAEGCEVGAEDEILDATSIRKLRNIANKVSASGYKDQGSKIMAAVAALEESAAE